MNSTEVEALKTWMEKQFTEQIKSFKIYVDQKLKEQREYIDERLEPIEKRLTNVEERLEEVRVDAHTINFNLTAVKVSQDVLRRDMGIMKVDITDLKRDMKIVEKEGSATLQMVQDIIKDAITRQEHEKLEKRVVILEQL